MRELPIGSVRPNPYQPRTRIDEAELTDLASSMEASGLLQPVIVRPRGSGFELIAGERRWRAAERLGWAKIPAVVKEVDDRTLLTLALIENLQRDDLSPIDEAAGYRRLGDEFQLGQSEIARAVGRERSTVANLLRLLQLPADVQTMVHEKRLSAGHARALLGLTDADRQSALASRGDRAGLVGPGDRGGGRRQAHAAAAGRRTNGQPARAGAGRRREAGRGCPPQAAWHRRPGHRPAAGPWLRHHQLLLQRRSLPPARAHTRRTLRGMKGGSRGVTVVIQRDGATRSQTLRFSLWTLRLGALLGAALLAGLGLLAVLYFPIVRAAGRVPGLESQVARLQAENALVRQLSIALDSAELRYEQLRGMIGADIVRDPLAISSTLPLAPALRARVGNETEPAGPGPDRAPGVAARPSAAMSPGARFRPDSTSRDEAHPGLDIAVPVGTMVRASGGATVNQIGEDPEYGYYVLLDHPEEYQTMYGHLSRIIVTDGQTVQAGEVIGLSGNSGRSTAPHLHFEIRQRGTSLDPSTMVKQGG